MMCMWRNDALITVPDDLTEPHVIGIVAYSVTYQCYIARFFETNEAALSESREDGKQKLIRRATRYYSTKVHITDGEAIAASEIEIEIAQQKQAGMRVCNDLFHEAVSGPNTENEMSTDSGTMTAIDECAQSATGKHLWGMRTETAEGAVQQCTACDMFRRVE